MCFFFSFLNRNNGDEKFQSEEEKKKKENLDKRKEMVYRELIRK